MGAYIFLPPADSLYWVTVLVRFSRDSLGKFTRWDPNDSPLDIEVADHLAYMQAIKKKCVRTGGHQHHP